MNIDNPLVSVVIPIYNGEKFLCETIESCLTQSHKNIEIILVDDCSMDSSIEIVQYYAQKDQRVKYILNSSNKGLMQTNNIGLYNSQGEYLIVLGHDDKLPPEHIENMVSIMEEGVSIAFCNSNFIDEYGVKGKKVGDSTTLKKKAKKSQQWITVNNFILSTGLIIRTSSLRSVGGWPTRYRNYGEWLLWVKLLSGGTVIYTESSSALYRRHENNMTNHFHNYKNLISLLKYRVFCRLLGMKLCSQNPLTIFMSLAATTKDFIRTLQLTIMSLKD